jgi:hypothetical protein
MCGPALLRVCNACYGVAVEAGSRSRIAQPGAGRKRGAHLNTRSGEKRVVFAPHAARAAATGIWKAKSITTGAHAF